MGDDALRGDGEELRTLTDYDAEISALKAERQGLAKLLSDAGERRARRVRRQQLLGRWAERLPLGGKVLEELRTISETEGWLWDGEMLAADGWVHEGDRWRFEGEAQSR